MSQDSLLAEALSAISAGIGTFDELLDHCLDNTDLMRLAEEEDVHADDYLLFVLEDSDRVTVTEDERVVRLDLLADGLVFTHRLTADEVAEDMVEMNPDLAVLDLGTREIHGPDGPISLEFEWAGYSPHGSWVGPPGWLSSFSSGELVAFRRSADSVVVEPAGEVGEGTEEAAALERVFEEVVGFEEEIGQEPWIILEEMIVADPSLFRNPVRPISELLADAGLMADGAFVGPADASWDPPAVAAQKEFRAGIIQRFGFEACCEAAFDEAIEAFRAHASGGHLNEREVNRALGHSRVAEALGEWINHFFSLEYARVGEFARALISPGRRHTGGAGPAAGPPSRGGRGPVRGRGGPGGVRQERSRLRAGAGRVGLVRLRSGRRRPGDGTAASGRRARGSTLGSPSTPYSGPQQPKRWAATIPARAARDASTSSVTSAGWSSPFPNGYVGSSSS
jgi:hypothetical protein